jgi:DNA-binding NtrC family response regulator
MSLSLSSQDPILYKSEISIFYIDDSHSMLEIIKIFLEKNPLFEVRTFLNPKIALPIITEEQPDIIISDYEMPGMNGVEFLGKMRSQGICSPFIIYTSHPRDSIGASVFDISSVHYVHKWGSIYEQTMRLHEIISQYLSNILSDPQRKVTISE